MDWYTYPSLFRLEKRLKLEIKRRLYNRKRKIRILQIRKNISPVLGKNKHLSTKRYMCMIV